MSTHNICVYGQIMKIIPELSLKYSLTSPLKFQHSNMSLCCARYCCDLWTKIMLWRGTNLRWTKVRMTW